MVSARKTAKPIRNGAEGEKKMKARRKRLRKRDPGTNAERRPGFEKVGDGGAQSAAFALNYKRRFDKVGKHPTTRGN